MKAKWDCTNLKLAIFVKVKSPNNRLHSDKNKATSLRFSTLFFRLSEAFGGRMASGVGKTRENR